MATPRCDLDTIRGRVIQALNAGQASTWTTTLGTVPAAEADDRRNDTEIDKAILAADARVCSAICESASNGYRPLFMSEVTVTHGTEVAEGIGPIGRPLIQPYSGADYVRGVPRSADDIDSYRQNTNNLYDAIDHDQSGSSLAGYYDFDPVSRVFSFTGYAAKVSIAVFTRTAACQAPESYEDTVFGIALTSLPKEGDSAPYLGLMGQQALQHIQEIKAGAMQVSPIDIPELAQVGAR